MRASRFQWFANVMLSGAAVTLHDTDGGRNDVARGFLTKVHLARSSSVTLTYMDGRIVELPALQPGFDWWETES